MTPTLLVLTDFSPAANRACDYATSLAVALAARLVLLHVRPDSGLDPKALGSKRTALSVSAAELALDSLVRSSPVPAVAELAHGRVLPAVTEALSRHQPNLVVLGRPDCDDLPDETPTTTALQILQHAPYPMLVVPPTRPSVAPPRCLRLAADGEAFTLGGFAGSARHLLGALQAKLTVVHCAPYFKLSNAPLESVLQTGMALDLPQPRTLQVVNTNPVKGILSAAQPADCDLLVMLARRRSRVSHLFHRSLTARVMLHCPVPVLVLPTQ